MPSRVKLGRARWMRALPLLLIAVTASAQTMLNQPARPTVPIKTSEDERKKWKHGESAHIIGKILNNTGDGLLVKGVAKGIKKTGDLFYIKGKTTLNKGTSVSAQVAYYGEYQYETAITGSLQTVPAFQQR